MQRIPAHPRHPGLLVALFLGLSLVIIGSYFAFWASQYVSVSVKDVYIQSSIVILLLAAVILTLLGYLLHRQDCVIRKSQSQLSGVMRREESCANFLAMATHQLRSPLGGLRWYSEMLLEEDLGELNPHQKELVVRMNESSKRLTETLNSLLALYTAEGGPAATSKSWVELKSLMKKVTDDLKLEINRDKLRVRFSNHGAGKIRENEILLRQVVANLISNAVRYSWPASTILVTVQSRGGESLWSVKDSGIGIPQAEQGRVFEKFFRASNAIKKMPAGSGLGLALVKTIVDSWQGKVWFESEEGKGTTFHFTVPKRTPRA